VAELVALDLPAGDAFVSALLGAWDRGDAVLPIDPRLPPPAVARLLATMAPTQLVDATGRSPVGGGRPVEPGDSLVVATSGTTGEPKGVILTTEAVESSARATSARLEVDADCDRWLACLPLAHIGGLAVVTRALITGTPLTVLPGFDARTVEEEAARGSTLVSLVATALGRTDVSGFRTVLVGGSAPPEVLPPQAVVTYGMTETGSGVVYDGRPLDGVEIRIGDGELGAPGEILVRGATLLRCYRDGTDPKVSGGWLPTGDAGAWQPDGSLVVLGRMDDVIVTGGEKVWPSALEEVLHTHPGVDQVAVGKRADPEWGQRVVAWVVPVDPAAPPTIDELRELAASRLAPWAAPRQVVTVDHLPRTASGKIRRDALA
jgi:o-succinylbenzoate---CoA ligase